MADAIDAWGPQLRAALEMNVFNPEAPLKEMDLDDIEALKDRYLNTKFLLGQSRNPFSASLLKELPSIAALQREGERVALDSGRGTSSTGPEERTPEAVPGVPVGSVEHQILRLKRIIELHMGEQRMSGGKRKKSREPLDAPSWAKPLPPAESCWPSRRISRPRSRRATPPLEKIVGPFHAKGDGGDFHWRKEVQTWDLVSLFSNFGHSYTARHLYAVWSHLPITIMATRGGQQTTSAGMTTVRFRRKPRNLCSCTTCPSQPTIWSGSSSTVKWGPFSPLRCSSIGPRRLCSTCRWPTSTNLSRTCGSARFATSGSPSL